MIIRSCIIFLHLLTVINEGSLENSIVGVIGGSVVLPCSAKEQQKTTQSVNVNWKHNNDLYVYQIIDGRVSAGQATAYINRTESFPEEYLNGNFSLKLNNLQYNDRGKYQCFIIEESDYRTVELLIKVPQQAPKGIIGGSVVLPCSSRRPQHTIEDVTVNWSHNDSLNVFDIIKGKVSVEKLDSAYKKRTETFPEEYLNGNFSLKLNNLQYSDRGEYQCFITNELIIESVKLEINQGAQSRPKKILLLTSLLPISILRCI